MSLGQRGPIEVSIDCPYDELGVVVDPGIINLETCGFDEQFELFGRQIGDPTVVFSFYFAQFRNIVRYDDPLGMTSECVEKPRTIVNVFENSHYEAEIGELEILFGKQFVVDVADDCVVRPLLEIHGKVDSVRRQQLAELLWTTTEVADPFRIFKKIERYVRPAGPLWVVVLGLGPAMIIGLSFGNGVSPPLKLAFVAALRK